MAVGVFNGPQGEPYIQSGAISVVGRGMIISVNCLFCVYCDGSDLSFIVESGNSVIHKCLGCGKLHMTRLQEERGLVVSSGFSNQAISVYGEIDADG